MDISLFVRLLVGIQERRGGRVEEVVVRTEFSMRFFCYKFFLFFCCLIGLFVCWLVGWFVLVFFLFFLSFFSFLFDKMKRTKMHIT